jgi:hypothetical protein
MSKDVRIMITKYDVTSLDRGSLPEEVLHELHEYENAGKELIAVSFYNTDDMDEDGHTLEMWELTFFEPFFSFEPSDYDTYDFVRVCYSNWPTRTVNTYYHNISRGDMKEALKYESIRQKEGVA